jgi:hypothetical protein
VESSSSEESSDDASDHEPVRPTSNRRKIVRDEPTASKRVKFSDLNEGQELRLLNPHRNDFDDEK